MTKPILWLGPIEELDADYDPLLGRSAAETAPKPTFAKAKTPFDLGRSVFDDPINEPLIKPVAAADITPIVQPAPEPEPEPDLGLGLTPAIEAAPEPLIVSEPTIELQVETSIEQVSAIDYADAYENSPQATIVDTETPVAPVADTTDFSHNNEPIPSGQGPVDNAATKLQSEPSASIAPEKSFFASLFGKRTIAPIAAITGASINDIWAKATPDPLPEVAAVPADEATIVEEVEADAPMADQASDVDPQVDEAASPATTTQPPAADMWAKINNENEVEADSLTLVPVLPEPPQPALDLPDVPAVPTITDEVLLEAIDQDLALKIGSSDLEDDEPQARDEPILEPEHVEATTVDVAQSAEPQAKQRIDFQRAFNADKFWQAPPAQRTFTPVSEEAARYSAEPAAPIDPLAEAQPEPEALTNFEPLPASDGTEKVSTSIGETPILASSRARSAAQKSSRNGANKRRKKKVKKSYVGAFFGTFLFGVALIMTIASSLAAFGYPFDLISSYRWYWVILSVLAAGIWGVSRGWKMVAASFLVMGANLFVTVPASGKAPSGGNSATAVVGWANVAGNDKALERVFKDADKKKATLLMLAETPQAIFTPPPGWTLIEAPIVGDPTAIAVLTKTNWRAATLPGEPTMARPPAGDLTVIGVHPQDANKGRRRTPMRDALLNRAGTRAGIQDGPTIVVGDFNAAPWDRAMGQFSEYGNVTRVRCGGWAGSTLTQAFGLIGVATDHAFVRDVKVTHCQLGGALTGGSHKPIWLYVAPLPAAAPALTRP